MLPSPSGNSHLIITNILLFICTLNFAVGDCGSKLALGERISAWQSFFPSTLVASPRKLPISRLLSASVEANVLNGFLMERYLFLLRWNRLARDAIGGLVAILRNVSTSVVFIACVEPFSDDVWLFRIPECCRRCSPMSLGGKPVRRRWRCVSSFPFLSPIPRERC